MIVATGLGAVSAVGRTARELWSALAEGRDGIRPIRRFAIDGIDRTIGALVPGYDEPRGGPQPHRGLSLVFARQAAREAWTHAELDGAGVPAHRIALVSGTSIGDDLHDSTPLETITETLGDELGIGGPRITVSTACTSSTNAIGIALDLLRTGAADVVIAGGTDVMTPEIYAGFHGIGVLSTEKCAPFSTSFGTTLGEGAGYLVLERREHAARRGAAAIAAIPGYGLSGDAFHETSPDPTGSGVARALSGALDDAGLAPDDIEYVNAHGTGTEANDRAEWRAISAVFGARAATLPVSSTKSILGHAQGAAGVLELITTILAMREGRIPQTLHFTSPRAFGPADPVGEPRPRPMAIRRAISSNSAFGGANAALVVAAPSAPPRAVERTRARRPVFVRGLGTVGPHGTSLTALAAALDGGTPLSPGNAAPFRIEAIVPSASPRGLNPSSRFLTAAAALALDDAGIRLRNAERDRTGLIVGTTRVSPESADEFRTSIHERGLVHLSAHAFARMVLNAPAGACSKLLMLRGPNSTIDTGLGSGLVAIAYAAHLLAEHRSSDLVLAGGLDEIDRLEPDLVTCEGATCAALGVAGEIAVAGWGIAGPDGIALATEQALAMAALTPDAVDTRVDAADMHAVFGAAPAAASAIAFADAVLRLRRGAARTALVTSAAGRSATCAIVLTGVGAR